MVNLSGKKVLFILASRNFRDPEFLVPEKVLEESGVKIFTASSAPISTGAEGAKVKVDVLLDKVNPADYDAVAFVGGPGSDEYFDDPTAHSIAKKTLESGKLLASICAAGSTLARAGVLKGKKATAFPSRGEDLKAHGADYTGKDVEIDGNIITANGPRAAKAFGEAIALKLM